MLGGEPACGLLRLVIGPISFEQIDSGAKGYYSLEDKRIVVQEGMSEAQTVKTLLHEASHQALHSREAFEKSGENKSKNQKETEAESVAYVVCQHYGIDTSDYSFAYVATWSADKEVPELKASLDTIRRAASELIVKIDAKVTELNVVNDKDLDSFIEEASKPEKADKKPSIKEKIKEEKAKSEKTKSVKKTPDKEMQAAM